MHFNKRMTYNYLMMTLVAALCSTNSLAEPSSATIVNYAQNIKEGRAVIQLGGFWNHSGNTQHINIEGLIGDDFTISHHQSSNGVIGLGYFIDGQKTDSFKLNYGINAFYLAKTMVTGNVIQEGLFNNLSYGYHVKHIPVYAAAKATLPSPSPNVSLTLDAGIGPNFISTSNIQEQPLDGITLPDQMFSGRTTTAFSATLGAGVKINHVLGKMPLECGYRFFYLGQGYFNKTSNQVVNTLNTGTNYANAVICAITI